MATHTRRPNYSNPPVQVCGGLNSSCVFSHKGLSITCIITDDRLILSALFSTKSWNDCKCTEMPVSTLG